VPLLPAGEAAPKLQAWQEQLKSLRAEIGQLEKEKPAEKGAADRHGQKLAALKKELRNLEKPGMPPDLAAAYSVQEGKPIDAHVHLRGEPENKGPVAPRCLPKFLAGTAAMESRSTWRKRHTVSVRLA
jgi:hypothetical protein